GDGRGTRIDGGEELVLLHGGSLGEIARRTIDVERDHLERGAGAFRELVDGGAPGPEIGNHLHGYFRRKGGDATRGDPVRAGKDENRDPVEARDRPALP